MIAYLAELGSRTVNFDVPPEAMTSANGWIVDGVDDRIGTEPPGRPIPNGLFTRAKQ